MADLNSLGLNDEGISEADFDKMPTTLGGGSRVPPQPGIYRFKLPSAEAIFKCFELMQTSDQGQKLVAVFADESSLYNETLKAWYNARINNRTRMVKLKDVDTIVSDFGMILKALKSKPSANAQGIVTNHAYGEALIAAAGRSFVAEHSLTAQCNPKRDIYRAGATVAGEKGCGQRYAVEGWAGKDGKPDVLSIPKIEGLVATRFTCKCLAEVSCFGELRGYRSAD